MKEIGLKGQFLNESHKLERQNVYADYAKSILYVGYLK
jgi:hypothetical protein